MFTDADHATNIKYLERLLRAVQCGADIAIGSRRINGANIESSQPWHRVWIGKFGNILIHHILQLPFKDTQCGFKLFRSKVAKRLFSDLQFPRWSFDYEILYKAKQWGLMVVEVPISWSDQKNSKFQPVRDSLECTLDLIKIRMRIR